MDKKAEKHALHAIDSYPSSRQKYLAKKAMSERELCIYRAVNSSLAQTRKVHPDGPLRCQFLSWWFWGGERKEAFSCVASTTSAAWISEFEEEILNQLNLRSCAGCSYWRLVTSDNKKVRGCFFCHDRGYLRTEDEAGRCLSKNARGIYDL